MTCKFSFEVPLKSLELQVEFSDYIFAIAPWFENETYRNFVHEHRSQLPLYLDNGAYEQGASIDIEKYIELIRTLHPDVVVAPDVYSDSKGTIELTRQFFKHSLPTDTKVMIVPQGRSIIEWTRCLRTLYSEFENRFHLVGIPRVMYPNRLFLSVYSFKLTSKPIHILGCPDPNELPEIFDSGVPVESLDTSYPTRKALGKVGLDDRIDFFNDRVSFKSMQKAVNEFFQLIQA